MKIRIVLLSLVLVLAFSACEVMNKAITLTNCKYELAGFASPSMAGVSLNNVYSMNDLNAVSLLKIGSAYMAGSLPFTITVNVNATNPNASVAEIEGLEWAVDMESKTLFTGNVDKRVSIAANGGKTVIPLNITVDLMEVLKGETKDDMFNFVSGLLNSGSASSKVAFRIKPSVLIGGQKISTPGFITLSKTVGQK